jgi:hypothetical protein
MLKQIGTSADGREHCKEEEVDADDVKNEGREKRRGCVCLCGTCDRG